MLEKAKIRKTYNQEVKVLNKTYIETFHYINQVIHYSYF